MSPINTSGGPSVAPQVLLWSYELRRENKILIEHIGEVESQLFKTEKHSRNLEQYLKSLTNLVAALDHIKQSNNTYTEERLQYLREQLKNRVLPLCESDQTLADKNKVLLNPPMDIPTTHLPSWLNPEITMTLSSMCQNERSLESYYDEANYLRRQSHPTRAEDEILVNAFISGCDDRLYRRRLDHAVRKGQRNWTRLSHEVQHLLNEEEYMENQKFALAHRNEDGSVLWPDGSVKHRFVAYLPFTEDDLTTSEDDESSSEADSKAKSI
ncbi:uncharacterized protein N7477_007052 [Penicillium maclennaniae]|uniref:uncharacterized protein n=1 Tax=Penicillium maclennaniae TaxID=1343394 RepID=UPI0025418AF9|nr:uncharacterized protein N7477_007052 [Penicillium maclennaniae]KAJ5668482.1 hypothetical protein N7477_007052 [Penicillium maclennaniae]